MERKLRALFDYQKFEGNSALAAVIDETEARYARALDDDDLSMVAAAGEALNEPENTDGGSPWYGIGNDDGTFEPGSGFFVKW